ncbi:hypothetical protein ACW7G2_00845 [Luteimonas sp. A277]
MQGPKTAGLVALLTVALAGGCTPANDSEPANAVEPQPTAITATSTADDAQPAALTDANLEAYARALAKQAEIIRRPGRGTHYGVTVSIYDSEGESGDVLEAAGMTVEEFHAVDRLVEPVFTTLNFQGEIGPPRSINLEEASPEWKERLAGDPFTSLPPESAAALRRHMDTLVPLWSDIVGMTAQHGQ